MRINNTPVSTGTETPGRVIRKIKLENGQILEISDLSRKISADAYVVNMLAAMEIKVAPELFDVEPLSGLTIDDIRGTLGEKVIYEYRLERNFILDHEKDGVLNALVDTFMKNMCQYISHPRFAPKLVLKQYREKNSIKALSNKAFGSRPPRRVALLPAWNPLRASTVRQQDYPL